LLACNVNIPKLKKGGGENENMNKVNTYRLITGVCNEIKIRAL
jgi:hypothetical protein